MFQLKLQVHKVQIASNWQVGVDHMRNSLLITKTNKLRNLDEFNVEIQLSTKKTIITKNANKTIRALEHLGWN